MNSVDQNVGLINNLLAWQGIVSTNPSLKEDTPSSPPTTLNNCNSSDEIAGNDLARVMMNSRYLGDFEICLFLKINR